MCVYREYREYRPRLEFGSGVIRPRKDVFPGGVGRVLYNDSRVCPMSGTVLAWSDHTNAQRKGHPKGVETAAAHR